MEGEVKKPVGEVLVPPLRLLICEMGTAVSWDY